MGLSGYITRKAIGLDYSDENQNRAAEIEFSETLRITKLISGSTDDTNSNLFSKAAESITILVGEEFAQTNVLLNVDKRNVDQQLRNSVLEKEKYLFDKIFGFSSAIGSSMLSEKVEGLYIQTKKLFPKMATPISTVNTSLYYGFRRFYGDLEGEKIGLLHITKTYASILLINQGVPVYCTYIMFSDGVKGSAIIELIYSARNNCREWKSGVYDRIIYSGTIGHEEIRSVFETSRKNIPIEPFNALRQGWFETDTLPQLDQEILFKHYHEFAVSICGATMTLEGFGIDLAGYELNLTKELPVKLNLEVKATVAGKFKAVSLNLYNSAIPTIMAQKSVISLFFLLSILIVGANVWRTESSFAAISNKLVSEQTRAKGLADVKAKFDDYKSKIGTLEKRIKNVIEIEKVRNTVYITMSEVDARRPGGAIFKELTIAERSINIRGYAPERYPATQFAKRLEETMLDSSKPMFPDVEPIYDDKNNTGNFTIKTTYNGPVPENRNRDLPDLQELSLSSILDKTAKNSELGNK